MKDLVDLFRVQERGGLFSDVPDEVQCVFCRQWFDEDDTLEVGNVDVNGKTVRDASSCEDCEHLAH